MKTLFLTNTYLAGNSGGVYATKAYINAFARISKSMTLVYSMKDGADATDILDDRITMVPIWDQRSKVRKFLDLCLGTVNRHQKNLFKYINPSDFDTVIFNNSDVSSGLIRKFKRLGLRTITIHHNYQIEYLRGDSGWITLLPSLFWTYIYEGQAVRNSDVNLTLTDEDAYLLKKHYGGNHFATLGVFEYKPSVSNMYEDMPRGHNYVITGWLGSKQTEDSLLHWIKYYYPILKENDSEVHLTIAGKDPSNNLQALSEKNGIKVIASPVEMQPILDSADYYICPTDRGGGLKLRNLDGLKSGLPILTHEVSARGYDYMKKEGVLRSYADTESFIEGILALKTCNLTKNEIVQKYKGYYSLEAGVARLSDLLIKDEDWTA